MGTDLRLRDVCMYLRRTLIRMRTIRLSSLLIYCSTVVARGCQTYPSSLKTNIPICTRVLKDFDIGSGSLSGARVLYYFDSFVFFLWLRFSLRATASARLLLCHSTP